MSVSVLGKCLSTFVKVSVQNCVLFKDVLFKDVLLKNVAQNVNFLKKDKDMAGEEEGITIKKHTTVIVKLAGPNNRISHDRVCLHLNNQTVLDKKNTKFFTLLRNSSEESLKDFPIYYPIYRNPVPL